MSSVTGHFLERAVDLTASSIFLETSAGTPTSGAKAMGFNDFDVVLAVVLEFSPTVEPSVELRFEVLSHAVKLTNKTARNITLISDIVDFKCFENSTAKALELATL